MAGRQGQSLLGKKRAGAAKSLPYRVGFNREEAWVAALRGEDRAFDAATTDLRGLRKVSRLFGVFGRSMQRIPNTRACLKEWGALRSLSEK